MHVHNLNFKSNVLTVVKFWISEQRIIDNWVYTEIATSKEVVETLIFCILICKRKLHVQNSGIKFQIGFIITAAASMPLTP